jgi:alpha-tubulin suppressor-like RCC1 family protein
MRPSRFLALTSLLFMLGCDGLLTEPESVEPPSFAKGGNKGKPDGGDTEDPIKFTLIEAGTTNLAGGHSCGLDVDGRAYCWGANSNFELGLGGKKRGGKTTPSAVTGGHVFHSLSVGMNHTCGIEDVGGGESGPVLCWGWNDWGGISMLGDGTTRARSEPTYTSLGTQHFIMVEAADFHSCAIADPGDGTDSGVIYCWGINANGEFGTGDTQPSSVPIIAAGGMEFKAIGLASGTACGVAPDGAAWCWGRNEHGGLGNGTIGVPSLTPVPVSGGLVFQNIVVNSRGVCGLTVSNEIYCWGAEAGLPSGANQLVPTALPVESIPDAQFAFLAANFCAIGTSGQAYCWGSNQSGQLGDGTFGGESITPVPVGAPGTFWTVDGGDDHTCGVGSDGIGYCWGLNESGQLGDGSTQSAAAPVAVSGQ